MATIAENIQTLRSIKSDIKNAITDKGGSVGNDFKTYAQAITNLPSGGGGGTEIEDALVTRTLSVYSNDRVSVVGSYAFAFCGFLKSISLPNCSYVGAGAFNQCALLSIDLPNCKSVGDNAFKECRELSSISLPLCSYIDNYTFYTCSALTSIELPLCEYLGARAFGFCSSLTSINIPLCSYIDTRAFFDCTNLAQVYLSGVSSVTTISSNTFSNCLNLTSVYVPASLVYEFKSAQNWSSISKKIVVYT